MSVKSRLTTAVAKPGAQSPRHGRSAVSTSPVSDEGERVYGLTSTTRHDRSCDYDRAALGRDLLTRPMTGMNVSMMTLEATRFSAPSQGTRQDLERPAPSGRLARPVPSLDNRRNDGTRPSPRRAHSGDPSPSTRA